MTESEHLLNLASSVEKLANSVTHLIYAVNKQSDIIKILLARTDGLQYRLTELEGDKLK
jgi:hypothetical protein